MNKSQVLRLNETTCLKVIKTISGIITILGEIPVALKKMTSKIERLSIFYLLVIILGNLQNI